MNLKLRKSCTRKRTTTEKYLNHIIEQEHWGIKRLVNPGRDGSFNITLKAFTSSKDTCRNRGGIDLGWRFTYHWAVQLPLILPSLTYARTLMLKDYAYSGQYPVPWYLMVKLSCSKKVGNRGMWFKMNRVITVQNGAKILPLAILLPMVSIFQEDTESIFGIALRQNLSVILWVLCPTSLGDKDHEGHWVENRWLPARLNGWTRSSRTLLYWWSAWMTWLWISMLVVMHRTALIDQITNLLPNANLLVASIPPIRDRPSTRAFNSTYLVLWIPRLLKRFVDVFSKLTSDLPDGIQWNCSSMAKRHSPS